MASTWLCLKPSSRNFCFAILMQPRPSMRRWMCLMRRVQGWYQVPRWVQEGRCGDLRIFDSYGWEIHHGHLLYSYGSLAIMVLNLCSTVFLLFNHSHRWLWGGGASSFLYASHGGSGAGAHPVFCIGLKRGHNVNMWLHPFVGMCVRFSVVWLEAQNISHMFTISSDALYFSFLPILQP
jgi:hypothetical protein